MDLKINFDEKGVMIKEYYTYFTRRIGIATPSLKFLIFPILFIFFQSFIVSTLTYLSRI
jgi:hypothetical protein